MFNQTSTEAISTRYCGGEDIIRQVKATTQQTSAKQWCIKKHLR